MRFSDFRPAFEAKIADFFGVDAYVSRDDGVTWQPIKIVISKENTLNIMNLDSDAIENFMHKQVVRMRRSEALRKDDVLWHEGQFFLLNGKQYPREMAGDYITIEVYVAKPKVVNPPPPAAGP